MVAQHDAAQASLMAQLKARRVKKTYLALVQGSVSAAVGRIEAPIGRDPKHRTRMAVVPDGRPSIDRLPRPRAVRRLDAARARPRHRPDAPDPGPPRRDRPPGRGRPGLRHGHVATRAGRARTGCSSTPGGSSSTSPSDGHLIRAEAPLPAGARAGPRRAARAVVPVSDAVERRPAIAAIGPTERRRRRARRDAGHHLGAVRGRQGHDHRRARGCARTTRSTTTSSPARRGRRAGRGRRRRLPLPDRARRSCALRDAGGFLEANEVHGNWYGTPRDQVREALAAGRDVDPQDRRPGRPGRQGAGRRGAPDLRRPAVAGGRCSQRLRSRATETADELELRQRNAAIELARQEDYDYVVTNETGQVERTAERIDEIIADEHASHPDRRVGVYPRSP